MEILVSQILENEKNLVCMLCRAERMPRETATAKYLWQNESPGIIQPNTQTSKPETKGQRLPTWSLRLIPIHGAVQMGGRMMGFVI